MQINYVGHNARKGFAVVDIHTNGHYHIMFFEKGVVQFFQERQAKSCEFNIDELIEFCKSKLPQAPVAGKETDDVDTRGEQWCYNEPKEEAIMHYPVEMYVKALEGMRDFEIPTRPPLDNEDVFKYAQALLWERGLSAGFKLAYKHAAEMLQMSPEALWTVYPDYFPEPEPPVARGGEE